ncbi:MAG: hypothetical protein HQ582_01505, partial [Planctomycetes bacterium]|nr:hypothetical protein [Planctomycetota bacterium]
MLWKTDNQATEVARRAFPEHAPRVLSNGKRQYVLEPTPYGRVELVGLDRGFMVAAEEPPGGARISPEALPPRLVKHLETHGLHAWKVVQSDDYSEVIRGLARGEPDEEGELAVPEREMIPFVTTVDASAELLGETRQERCEQVAGLADSQRFPGPLVQLVGPDGVGKRTMAAAVARQMGWSLLGELPLSRVFVNRVLQTPPETALDTVLTAGASLAPDQLLLVSDAEMLELLGDHTSE